MEVSAKVFVIANDFNLLLEALDKMEHSIPGVLSHYIREGYRIEERESKTEWCYYIEESDTYNYYDVSGGGFEGDDWQGMLKRNGKLLGHNGAVIVQLTSPDRDMYEEYQWTSPSGIVNSFTISDNWGMRQLSYGKFVKELTRTVGDTVVQIFKDADAGKGEMFNISNVMWEKECQQHWQAIFSACKEGTSLQEWIEICRDDVSEENQAAYQETLRLIDKEAKINFNYRLFHFTSYEDQSVKDGIMRRGGALHNKVDKLIDYIVLPLEPYDPSMQIVYDKAQEQIRKGNNICFVSDYQVYQALLETPAIYSEEQLETGKKTALRIVTHKQYVMAEEAHRQYEEARRRREEERQRKAEEARRKREEERQRKAEARRKLEEEKRARIEAAKQEEFLRKQEEKQRLREEANMARRNQQAIWTQMRRHGIYGFRDAAMALLDRNERAAVGSENDPVALRARIDDESPIAFERGIFSFSNAGEAELLAMDELERFGATITDKGNKGHGVKSDLTALIVSLDGRPSVELSTAEEQGVRMISLKRVWELIFDRYDAMSSDEREALIPKGGIKYAPGEEPANIHKRLDTLFAKLDSAYPDKVISRLQKDHKKWGETVTELYRLLGYPDGAAFLESYGYTIERNAVGRPITTDPTSIIEQLLRRYPDGCAESMDALKQDNPDIPWKTLANNARAYFGDTLVQYMKRIGLLADDHGPRKLSQTYDAESAETTIPPMVSQERQRLAEEALRKREEERQRLAEEARRKREEESRKREEERQRKAEAMRKLEEERQRLAEEARCKREEERQRKAEAIRKLEEERQRLAEEARRKREAERQRKAEAKRKLEEEKRRQEAERVARRNQQAIWTQMRQQGIYGFRDVVMEILDQDERAAAGSENDPATLRSRIDDKSPIALEQGTFAFSNAGEAELLAADELERLGATITDEGNKGHEVISDLTALIVSLDGRPSVELRTAEERGVRMISLKRVWELIFDRYDAMSPDEREALIPKGGIRYAPGEEPPKLRARLDTLFAKLDDAYPNRKISRLDLDHKNWSETVTELYQLLGYLDRQSFLKAYGYTVEKSLGGRPVSTDPPAIMAELHRRYSDGGVESMETLKRDNPDIPWKMLTNTAKTYFGRSLMAHLKAEGIIKPK